MCERPYQVTICLLVNDILRAPPEPENLPALKSVPNSIPPYTPCTKTLFE